MKRFVVALTGASGALYFERTLRALLVLGHTVDLVISKYGLVTLKEETDYGAFDGSVAEWVRAKHGEALTGELVVHGHQDQTARIASGSAVGDGMVVVPCTMKTLAGIAHGASTNLIERAADVMLKERRPLILVPREAPMNLIHLRNLVAVAEAGAAVVPASPAFYQHPQTFDELGDFIAARVLSLFGVPAELFTPWLGNSSLGRRAP